MMKNLFRSFYELEKAELEEVLQDEKTIFIFDTNVLLNLYQYSSNTRGDFFNVLEFIQDKSWLPFHVVLEYSKRRLFVIRNEKKIFSEINKKVADIEKKVNDDFKEFKFGTRNPLLESSFKEFQSGFLDLLKKFKENINQADERQPCVRSDDKIRRKIESIFGGKIGTEFKQTVLDEIYEQGKDRFDKKIPPGYEDRSKERDDDNDFTFNGLNYKRSYGDLIIWKQIIEYCKNNNNEIKNVIFITDDVKEDWWNIIQSNGKKRIGARYELKNEIYMETEIEYFHMYNTSEFMKGVSVIMNNRDNVQSKINDSSIEEISSFSDRNILELEKERFLEMIRYREEIEREREDLEREHNILEMMRHREEIEREDLERERFLEMMRHREEIEREDLERERFLDMIRHQEEIEREDLERERFLDMIRHREEIEREDLERERFLDMIRHQEE